MSRGEPRLTRRDVIGGAVAAAGAGMLLAPGAALARGEASGRDRVFSVAVGRVSGESPVIVAARRFVLAGVQWSGPAGGRIELRARARAGRWSPWALASVRGHEPDGPAESGALFGEPLWFGPVEQIQVRSAAPVSGVRLHCVAAAAIPGAASLAGAASAAAIPGRPGVASTAAAATSSAALPLAQPVLPAGPGQPAVIARSAWAGARNGPGSGPFYGAVQLAFVHHSDNPNGYSAGQVPAMILAIYDYHRFSRGYFDIAYNFMIDAFGRIWEARAGGVAEPVIGAHAGGYNAVSTGICVLGTFNFALPSQAAITSLQALLAWKLSLHGIPTVGKVGVVVDPAAAFYTPFAPGQRVMLPRIAGHRDGDLTDCPGTHLYDRLPAIRSRATTLAGSPVRLTLLASSATVAPSAPVTLSGLLSQLDATPIAGASLQVQTVTGSGALTTIATATTGADGTWSVAVTLTRSEVVQAMHADAPASISNLVAVGVIPAVTLALASTAPLRVVGTVVPAKLRVTIAVYKLSGRHRRLVHTAKVRTRRGAFSLRLSLGRGAHGSYEVIARTVADAVSAAGTSVPLPVTV
jgi:hypothetical protein